MEPPVLKVLLVGKTASDGALLHKSLTRAEPGRFFICRVSDLNDAEDRLRQYSCDVMVIDISAAKEPGDDECLQARAIAPHVPIVVLASLENESASVGVTRLGIDEYLLKRRVYGRPLAHAIQRAIERKRLEAGLRKTQSDLEQVIAQRTSDLVEINRALKAEMERRQASDEARQEAVRRLRKSEETERARIARELHDRLGQDLTAMKLGLRNLEKQCPIAAQVLGAKAPSRSARRGKNESCLFASGMGRSIRRLEELTDGLMKDVHRLATELHPAALDSLGLEAALRRYTAEWSENTGVPVDLHGCGVDGRRLPLELETAFYRITQEALTNVIRHAHARRVSVLVERRRAQASLIIEDDGAGFDPAIMQTEDGHGKLGLLGIRERVLLLHGKMEIESALGMGTTLFVRIPLETQRSELHDEKATNPSGR